MTLGTFKVSSEDAPFATSFNTYISQYNAQGYNILNAGKTGFSTEFKEGVEALMATVEKMHSSIS